MNGSKVLTFAMNIVPENVKVLLKKIRCKVINIDMFIFHQASQFILTISIVNYKYQNTKLLKIYLRLETPYQLRYP